MILLQSEAREGGLRRHFGGGRSLRDQLAGGDDAQGLSNTLVIRFRSRSCYPMLKPISHAEAESGSNGVIA